MICRRTESNISTTIWILQIYWQKYTKWNKISNKLKEWELWTLNFYNYKRKSFIFIESQWGFSPKEKAKELQFNFKNLNDKVNAEEKRCKPNWNINKFYIYSKHNSFSCCFSFIFPLNLACSKQRQQIFI